MQTLAHFVLCSSQIGPCWQIGHFQVGLQGFHCHVQLAAINISHKGTGLYFENANDKIHLPIIVNGSCFSPDNVFSIRCILCVVLSVLVFSVNFYL